jgi:hypothetical protein
VELTAVPEPSWVFDAWSDDLTGSSNPETIVMDGNKTVTATFVESTALYSQDFEGYAAGANPDDWLDTGAYNSLSEDDSLFQVHDVAGNKAFGTTSTQTNIHSHYVGTGSDAWAGYRYSGRMRMTNSYGGIGVTVLSQYANSDAYYRLRRYGSGSFHINRHPDGTPMSGGTFDTGVVPVANVWYHFVIEVEDTGTRTEVRAKVWAEGAPEPTNWQAEAYDDNSTRLTTGTVGVWSCFGGNKYWDDLTVEPR